MPRVAIKIADYALVISSRWCISPIFKLLVTLANLLSSPMYCKLRTEY